MPAPIDEIELYSNGFGEARDKIAADNNIGAGTVTSIVDNYKIGLDNLDFGSFRELMVEAKKREMTPSDLASNFRVE
jgi:cell division GTPase FtsZ